MMAPAARPETVRPISDDARSPSSNDGTPVRFKPDVSP
jgi:hypothetical protein